MSRGLQERARAHAEMYDDAQRQGTTDRLKARTLDRLGETFSEWLELPLLDGPMTTEQINRENELHHRLDSLMRRAARLAAA